MRRVPGVAILEIVVCLAIAALCLSLLLPDTGTQTRRDLERRVRDWERTPVATLAEPSLLSRDCELSGDWIDRGKYHRNAFSFRRRSDDRYSVDFTTNGCMGGIGLERVSCCDKGVITLNAPVAEYSWRTYDLLYAICVDETDYLLPAESVEDFERERAAGTDVWQRYVFRRKNVAGALQRP